MALAKSITAQRDFSAGELDIDIKRVDDSPFHKAGARQMSNWRVLNSHALQNRPGRSALFKFQGRVEEIQVSANLTYIFAFHAFTGTLGIHDASGTLIALTSGKTWVAATLNQIVWSVVQVGAIAVDVVICFTGTKPLVAHFDGVSAWTFGNFAFQTDTAGNALVPFYRIAAPSITMDPSGTSGSITVVFSAAVLDTSTPSLHIGAQFRYATRRLIVTAVASAVQATMTCIDTLPGTQVLQLNTAPIGAHAIAVGDLVIGATTGCQGLVTAVNGGASTITVQIINNLLSGFILFSAGVGENIATPSTTNNITNVGTISTNPAAIAVWDEQMISDARGWPQSTFTDQNRLGFCDLPGTPRAILWSWIGLPYDFDCGGNSGAVPTPDYAIAELVPDKTRVYYVVPGPESSEFVFCANKLYYIPISPTNPLKPGSVAFQVLSSDGSARVQPRVVQEVIVYINAGQSSVMSVVAPGAYYRPYQTRDLSSLHNHLLNTPLAIAIPTADGPYPERYAYVLNIDGSVAVAKYEVANGEISGTVSWVPWTGSGSVLWVSALNAAVVFDTVYPIGTTGLTVAIAELLDNTQFLDSAVFVNALPNAMPAPAGKGPLWFMPSGTVTLIDLGTRFMGTYDIDANGNIIPQGIAGENLSSVLLVAGQPWNAVLEPFAPAVQPGADQMQRMRKRRIARAEVYVRNSTGFLFTTLFAGPTTPTSPPLGTVMKQRRITTWNQDDDPTQPPPQREQAYAFKPIGRAHDPRVAIMKDTPGPIQVLEVAMEVSV